MKTIIALYDNLTTAQQIVQDLITYGIHRDNITLVARNNVDEQQGTDSEEHITVPEGAGIGALGGGTLGFLAGMAAIAIPGIGPILAVGPLVGALTGAGVGLVTGGIAAGVSEMEISEDEADYYIEGLRRGGGFVAVRASDDNADHLEGLMSRYKPVSINVRSNLTTPYMAPEIVENRLTQAIVQEAKELTEATPATLATLATPATQATPAIQATPATQAQPNQPAYVSQVAESGSVEVLPVVEEQLQVGKRVVEGGGLRIHTHVTETPITEPVQVRSEEVIVERRPVNRIISEAELTNLEDRTIEIREMAEELVISKEARVVEEVLVHKNVIEQTETVHDTLRRRDIEVEKVYLDAQAPKFIAYDEEFRYHYQNTYPDPSTGSGTDREDTYEQARHAYLYGYVLAHDPLNRTRTWQDIEPKARRDWEQKHAGTWDKFKEAIQYAWNRTHL